MSVKDRQPTADESAGMQLLELTDGDSRVRHRRRILHGWVIAGDSCRAGRAITSNLVTQSPVMSRFDH